MSISTNLQGEPVNDSLVVAFRIHEQYAEHGNDKLYFARVINQSGGGVSYCTITEGSDRLPPLSRICDIEEILIAIRADKKGDIPPPKITLVFYDMQKMVERGTLDVGESDTPFKAWSDAHSFEKSSKDIFLIPVIKEADARKLPNTGSMTNFGSGAVRDGATGKGLPSRVPPIALRALFKRFEDGKVNYPDSAEGIPNWMQGIPLSRFIEAQIRHSLDMAEGKTNEDHAGAVMWNAAAFIWTLDAINRGILPKSLNDLPFFEGGPILCALIAQTKALMQRESEN